MVKTAGREHCIIVGAGAAGLMAARELSAVCQVTVLEARHLPGGRIRTLKEKNTEAPVEMGAEFIHGKLPITLQLLKEAGLEYDAVEGALYRVIGGEWKEGEETTAAWEELLQRMQQATEDWTLSAFLDTYYSGEEQASFREKIIRYAQGFDLADSNKAGIKGLCSEWINEAEENFRIRKGYGALIDFLADDCIKKGCTIRPDQQVKKLVWEKGKLAVYTNTASFTGDKVIITVPLGVLQNERAAAGIAFEPAIPEYIRAAQTMGYGAVIKMTLGFSRPFWNDYMQPGFIISNEPIGTWWISGPADASLLTGWLGGPPADEWSNAGEDWLLEQGLNSLSAIFRMDIAILRSLCSSHYIANWRREPLSLGAYSYPTPASAGATNLLNTPISDTIYFAGEALYEGKSPGTVEAALESGKKVAGKVRESL